MWENYVLFVFCECGMLYVIGVERINNGVITGCGLFVCAHKLEIQISWFSLTFN